MTEPKICVHCKFCQAAEPIAPGKNVDYTIYSCTQATPHVLCHDNRRTDGACGPEGKFWEHK